MESSAERQADRASAQRRELDTTPEELCAILGRELRSPLATAESYLDLLASGGAGALSEEQLEMVRVVMRNISRLSTVVGDWLDISKLEAGRLPLVRQPVDLEEVVDRAIAGLRPELRFKEQQVRVETPGVPILAHGDLRALRRAVGNLLSNAHKYTPVGGTITVRLSVEADERVRIDVADTGIGISEDDRPRLFRKYFRAHLTDAEPGTGLGLALTRALVEQLGGTVSMESTLGKGSTFSIVVPQAVRPAGQGSTPLASPAIG